MRRGAKVLIQLALVVAGVVLTVANSAGPPVRGVAKVGRTSGKIALQLDKRRYADKAFEVALPAGTYSSLTLTAYVVTPTAPPRPGQPAPEPVTTKKELLRIEAGDPRLTGPSRIKLFDAEAQTRGLHNLSREYGVKNFVLVVEAADGREGRVEFRLEGVQAKQWN